MQNAPTGILRDTLPFPATISHNLLGDATPETVAVPEGAIYVVVSVSGLCYMRTGGSAATPSADVSDGTGVAVVWPGYNPPLNVRGMTSFSISADPEAVAASTSGFLVASFCWYGDHS